jgi:hypothetical protein
VGDIEEFLTLHEFVQGQGYNCDLERLRDGKDLDDRDLARVDALSDYLVEIHRVSGPDPELYIRRTRELVGHHECIMGILESYPRERARVHMPTERRRRVSAHCRISGTRELAAAANQHRPQLLPRPSNWRILFARLFVFGVMTSPRSTSRLPLREIARLAQTIWTTARFSLEPISRSQIEHSEVANESESRMVDHRA